MTSEPEAAPHRGYNDNGRLQASFMMIKDTKRLLPELATRVVERLQSAGFTAYWAGVRDLANGLLLGVKNLELRLREDRALPEENRMGDADADNYSRPKVLHAEANRPREASHALPHRGGAYDYGGGV